MDITEVLVRLSEASGDISEHIVLSGCGAFTELADSCPVINRAMVTMVTICLLLGGTGACLILGETGAAEVSPTRIPEGFLLTEPTARAPLPPVAVGEEWWKISDSTSRQFELNPCGTKGKSRDGRVAMRTITHLTSGPSYDSEQLALYPSAGSAHAAFLRLRTDMKRCARQETATRPGRVHVGRTLHAGDEAMIVGSHFSRKGKRDREPSSLWGVGRRGAALFLYTHDIAGRGVSEKIAGQVRKMAEKVCALRGVCG
ncbi:hypothetical protein [Streptosporangium sp. LJ11]|uniref:hypothetical protein n=1 Tax=Streptosporangium sp. LJ11 TaxID=3436927 RepID=UPI003F7A3FCF